MTNGCHRVPPSTEKKKHTKSKKIRNIESWVSLRRGPPTEWETTYLIKFSCFGSLLKDVPHPKQGEVRNPRVKLESPRDHHEGYGLTFLLFHASEIVTSWGWQFIHVSVHFFYTPTKSNHLARWLGCIITSQNERYLDPLETVVTYPFGGWNPPIQQDLKRSATATMGPRRLLRLELKRSGTTILTLKQTSANKQGIWIYIYIYMEPIPKTQMYIMYSLVCK